MKKLLSLLIVLTISGTAFPTTIAASPYKKKEKLTQTKIERHKSWRSSDKILHVTNFKQIQQYWCGPAVRKSILEYFGLTNISPMQHHISERNSFQSSLALSISTYFGSCTNTDNFVNALNNIILQNNLNYKRLYSITIINYGYSIINFENMIRNSLQNNVPVALAYRGNLPEYFSENSDISNHFIIIDNITGTKINTMRETNLKLTFHYMDPWNRNPRNFWKYVS